MKLRILLFMAALALARAANYYVSATATNGTGTSADPWTLNQALASGTPTAGDTIWIRGGTYTGKYTTALTGASGNHVKIRGYPGERVIIDGYRPITLTISRDAVQTSWTVSETSHLHLADTLRVDSERVRVQSITSSTTITVLRAIDGTVAASHNAGATINNAANILGIGGGFATYRDLEITYSGWTDRSIPTAGSAPPELTAGEGIYLGSGVINLENVLIHDAQDAVFTVAGSGNITLNGCITYYTGWQGPDRGHGHGSYIQNSNPANTRTVRDNISFYNFATGMKAFGVAAPADNVEIDGVISFENGRIGTPVEANIYIGTDSTQQTNIVIKNNNGYFSGTAVGQNFNAGFSYTDNNVISVTNNRFYGGKEPFSVKYWRDATVTGNKVWVPNLGTWSSQELLNFTASSFGIVQFTWDNNSYFDSSPVFAGTGFRYDIQYPPNTNHLGGGRLRYEEWKVDCACDASSTYTVGKPTVNEYYIRVSTVEANRATLAIFNWQLLSTVSVDLSSVLSVGDPFQINYAMNITGSPVLSGIYTGGSVSVPMTAGTILAPVGTVPTTPTDTRPEFGAFVVRRLQRYPTVVMNIRQPYAAASSIRVDSGYTPTLLDNPPFSTTCAAGTTCGIPIDTQLTGNTYYRITYLTGGGATVAQSSVLTVPVN